MIGYRAEGTICNDRRPSQNLAGGLEGVTAPSSGSRAEPWWGPREKAP